MNFEALVDLRIRRLCHRAASVGDSVGSMAGVRPGRRALSCLNPLPPRIVNEESDMMPMDAPREGWGGGGLDDSVISERAANELDDSVISERAANELDSSTMSVSDLNR